MITDSAHFTLWTMLGFILQDENIIENFNRLSIKDQNCIFTNVKEITQDGQWRLKEM